MTEPARGAPSEHRRVPQRHEAVRRRSRSSGTSPSPSTDLPGQGRVHRHPRAVRLRQVDGAAAHRRAARRTIRRPTARCSSAASRSTRPAPIAAWCFRTTPRSTTARSRTTSRSASSAAACRRRERRERAREWIGKVGLDVKRDATKYPEPAVRRHAPARGDRAHADPRRRASS